MKRYLVKTVSVGTCANPNFAGDVSICYSGKGQKILYLTGDHNVGLTGQALWRSDIRDYGYSRRCDAERSYEYNHLEDGYGYWHSMAFIVEFDVDDSCKGRVEGIV